MQKKIVLAAVVCISSGAAVWAAEIFGSLPAEWSVIGIKKESYDVGVDPTLTGLGKRVAVIRCKQAKMDPAMFGGIMQSFKADRYRGKRLLFFAQIRTRGADYGAGLWMRVDGAQDAVLAFDNMQGRPVRGNSDWQSARIILDVPSNAKAIFYGALLYGNGQAWVTGMKFETVGKDVELTDLDKVEEHSLPLEPMNLAMLP